MKVVMREAKNHLQKIQLMDAILFPPDVVYYDLNHSPGWEKDIVMSHEAVLSEIPEDLKLTVDEKKVVDNWEPIRDLPPVEGIPERLAFIDRIKQDGLLSLLHEFGEGTGLFVGLTATQLLDHCEVMEQGFKCPSVSDKCNKTAFIYILGSVVISSVIGLKLYVNELKALRKKEINRVNGLVIDRDWTKVSTSLGFQWLGEYSPHTCLLDVVCKFTDES